MHSNFSAHKQNFTGIQPLTGTVLPTNPEVFSLWPSTEVVYSWLRHIFLLQDKMKMANSDTKLMLNSIAPRSLGLCLKLLFFSVRGTLTQACFEWTSAEQPSCCTCARHLELYFRWFWKMTDGFSWYSIILDILQSVLINSENTCFSPFAPKCPHVEHQFHLPLIELFNSYCSQLGSLFRLVLDSWNYYLNILCSAGLSSRYNRYSKK